MKLAVFSAKAYDRRYLERARAQWPALAVEASYHELPLGESTAGLARGADAVCVFVNDAVGGGVLAALARGGVRAVLLRCAGANNVDLAAAEREGIMVANVPAYAPEAVAEFAVALLQTLNRKTHRAWARVREANFALDGLLGRTLRGKTVGIVGTGRIGLAAAAILGPGFGCRLLAYDPCPDRDALAALGGRYAPSLDALLPECDVVSLHCPLTDATRHLVNRDSLALMRPGVLLVNTSRGGLVDTRAAIDALKSRHLGGLALDVYEAEGPLFYDDHSADIIQDDALMRLLTFPNVLVCGHQAFFTDEALAEIADATLRNLSDFAATGSCPNSLTRDPALHRADSMPVRNV
ncbi:hypothetical protein CDD83_8525 [Cordyceps sp. RAO-2017]|nr:hypothetical protein CDD83_8525 [Cordyceps sp. RAO-2017]